MNTSENKAQKKLIEIVLYMAGMLMYHTNIFGKHNLDDLNKKIGELLAIMQDEEYKMNEVPKIIEDFLKGNNDAGGTISSLEDEAKRLSSKIDELENVRDTAYNTTLEWAANWIIGAQLSGHGVEVQRYANTIRAAKRGLTPRPVHAACTCGSKEFYTDKVLGVVCCLCQAPRQ